MSPIQVLATTAYALACGASVAGALWVFGERMPAYAWAAIVCWVAALVVALRHSDPVEPRHWMRW